MSEITVAHGWQHILDEAVEEAAALPPEWCFEIVHAWRVDGMLDLWATYASRDIPLDDHLPPTKRSRIRIARLSRSGTRLVSIRW